MKILSKILQNLLQHYILKKFSPWLQDLFLSYNKSLFYIKKFGKLSNSNWKENSFISTYFAKILHIPHISKENLQKITARISEVSINLVYCIIIYTAVLWTETQLTTPAPLSTEYTGFKPESKTWCGNTALLPRFSLQGRCCCPDARNTTSREPLALSLQGLPQMQRTASPNITPSLRWHTYNTGV